MKSNIEEMQDRVGSKDLILDCTNFEEYIERCTDKFILYLIEKNIEYAKRAFWSIKNYPETYHMKALLYPNKQKLSDFLQGVEYKYDQKNPRGGRISPTGVYIMQSYRSNKEKFGDVLEFDKQRAEFQNKRNHNFPTAYCELQDGILEDPNDFGKIELIDRQEGMILIASYKNYIGSVWLGIVTDFDVEIKHN